MKREPTPFEQAVGGFIVVLAVIAALALIIGYSIDNAKSRDARDQYTSDTGCTWAGNDASGYHMEC